MRSVLPQLLFVTVALTPWDVALAQAKPHAEQAAEHAGEVPVLLRRTFQAAKQQKAASDFTHVIYGYYPYWASTTDPLPWEHLTHLAYFSVDINADGTLGSNHGWAGAGRNLVAAASAHGVKVTLTATLFDNATIAALLVSPARRSTLVQNLLALVQTEGAHGVNIDFEYVPLSAKGDFVAFMTLLTSVFHEQIPGSHVSLAAPAVDWAGSYDYDLLALACDGLMIMGYDYYWSSSDPGPTSPISVGTTWAGRDLRWTTNDYLRYGGAANRDRFVLGLPLYGRTWPTTDDQVPGTKTANGTATTLKNCDTSFLAGKTWDADSQTPYRVYQQTSAWQQLFCEDTESLAAKFDLAVEVDFGGVMLWAVGYAPIDHPLWQELDLRFKRQTQNLPPMAIIAEPPVAWVGDPTSLDGSTSYDPGNDLLSYAWAAIEGPVVAIERADRPVALVTAAEPGSYRFSLTVSDGSLSATAETTVQVVARDDAPVPTTLGQAEGGCPGCAATPGLSWLGLAVAFHRVHGKRRSR
jgi:spore germination protein YaaH